jgi:hypothetical protein
MDFRPPSCFAKALGVDACHTTLVCLLILDVVVVMRYVMRVVLCALPVGCTYLPLICNGDCTSRVAQRQCNLLKHACMRRGYAHCWALAASAADEVGAVLIVIVAVILSLRFMLT